MARLKLRNIYFTRHFVKQLNKVLTYYAEERGYKEFSGAVLECILIDLRSIAKSPARRGSRTSRPGVYYTMVMDVNVTYYYDPVGESLTVLTVCTDL